MSLPRDQIKTTIAAIDALAEPSSHRYGQLLQWQNFLNPVWHYGIGLSDTHILDTGGILRPVESRNGTRVLGIDHLAFAPEQTIERAKQALYVFAGWDYNLLGWNCEHLGRLIATDQPRCYQSRPVWFLCNLTPNGDHKTAQRLLRDHLRQVNPGLLGALTR